MQIFSEDVAQLLRQVSIEETNPPTDRFSVLAFLSLPKIYLFFLKSIEDIEFAYNSTISKFDE